MNKYAHFSKKYSNGFWHVLAYGAGGIALNLPQGVRQLYQSEGEAQGVVTFCRLYLIGKVVEDCDRALAPLIGAFADKEETKQASQFDFLMILTRVEGEITSAINLIELSRTGNVDDFLTIFSQVKETILPQLAVELNKAIKMNVDMSGETDERQLGE